MKYCNNYKNLITTGTDGKISIICTDRQKNTPVSVVDVGSENQSAQWLHALDVIDRCNGYLSDMCMSNDVTIVITGDSNGYITLYIMQQDRICLHKKIHAGLISDVKVHNGFIYTASHDRTVKIWDGKDFRQVGQFFCQAPVSSLVKAPQLGNDSFLCGDTLGNLYFLKWQS
ncbi:uncharacterized protein LOC102804060 [Saccoglossus kowalevskii]